MKTNQKRIISFVMAIAIMISCCVTAGAYSFNQNGISNQKHTAYRLPSTSSNSVWWTDKNDKVQVLCRDNGFYLVMYPFNQTGKHVLSYVPTSVVDVSGNVPDASNFYQNIPATALQATFMYHNPSTDSLIGASGADNCIRARISKGEEVKILFEKDGFYCVRTSNDTGFVEKNALCQHKSEKKKPIIMEYEKINESQHYVVETYDSVCDTCGKTINSNQKQKTKADHEWNENKCGKCLYIKEVQQPEPEKENTEIKNEDKPVEDIADCKHTKTYEIGSLKSDEFKGQKDSKYHLFLTYVDIECANCKKILQKEVEKLVEEEHLFNGDYCMVCAYDKSNKKAEASTISADNKSIKVNGSVNFTWTRAEYANTYDLHIYKNGSRIELISGIENLKYTYKFTSSGTYEARIYSINNNGEFTTGSAVTITVSEPETTKTAYVYNTEGANLNLRAQPTTSSSIIGKMPEGSTVTVIGNVTSGFYKVTYGSKTGYASATYLTFTKPTVSTPAASVSSSYVWPSSGGYLIYVLDYYYGTTSQGKHPTKGGGSIKGAIDIATSGNALATATGTVISTQYGYSGGWGNNVTIKHDDGTYSFYAHLSKINVSVNQRVNAGQAIGVIGTTGNSTGVHLHFEIWDKNKNTIYTIDAFKEKYKKQLVYDGDIVTGGSNSSAIRSWVKNNYKMVGGRWVCK